MLKGLISSILAVGSMGAPILANEQGQNNSIVERVINEPISAVVYDDNAFTITLTYQELNDYTWSNLVSFFVDNGQDLVNITCNYNDIQMGGGHLSTGHIGWEDNITGDYGVQITRTDSYQEMPLQYHFYFINDGTPDDFESSLVFDCSQSQGYDDMVNAIELDIQANQPSQNTMPSVSDLFGYITQGVTAFIGSIGEAFNSVVALFWTTGTNAGPTFLGLLMLVSIGAGLIFLAYNVIKKLVYRLRG